MDLIIEQVVKLAFDIAAPILMVLVGLAVARFYKLTGYQIGAETQARLEAFARLAILQTEEWAALKVKQSDFVVSGEQKLSNALAIVLTKVPGVSHQEAEDAIKAKLPELGYGAANFLRAVRQAAVTEPASSPEPAQ
jgi:hypothetical protein